MLGMHKRNPAFRDAALDSLLQMDGATWAVDEDAEYFFRVVVRSIAVTPNKPHGLDYSLTLHEPDSGDPKDSRLVGFDNAHAVAAGSGPGAKKPTAWDHKHRLRTVQPYEYQDAATLLSDFFKVAEAVLKERGILR